MTTQKTKSTQSIPDDIKKMSFEEALAALEEIVTQLESGDIALEESITIYTRGNQLRAHCEAKLKNAQAQIEKITGTNAGGTNAKGTNAEGTSTKSTDGKGTSAEGTSAKTKLATEPFDVD